MPIVRLSLLDLLQPPPYIRHLLCFPCDDGKRVAIKLHLRNALNTLIRAFPFLAGKVILYPEFGKGHRALEYHAVSTDFDVVEHGTLRYNESKISYAELKGRGFPTRSLQGEDLHWLSAYAQEEAQVLSIQANFLQDGLILAFWWHHAVLDGNGTEKMYKHFDKAIDGKFDSPYPTSEELEKLVGGSMEYFHRLHDTKLQPVFQAKHSSAIWKTKLSAIASPSEQKKNVISEVFKFRITDLRRILKVNGLPASTFRCVQTLMFAAISRARLALGLKCIPRCVVVMDVRGALGRAGCFMGNSVNGALIPWPYVTALLNAKDLSELPDILSNILDEIGAGIEEVRKPESMRQRLEFIHHHLYDLGTSPEQIQYNWNLAETDVICNTWEGVGMTCGDLKFDIPGLGCLDCVRRPHVLNEGSSFVYPRTRDSEFLEVDVSLEENTMKGLVQELAGWRERGWLISITSN